jgi:hypothetical protein
MNKKKIVYLSASRIKTLESCSWLYWGKYHLHLPDTGNDGSARGTVCHRIFELLLSKKNFKYFELIISKESTEASKAVCRLIRILLKNQGFYNEENYDLCLKMILVGLKCDFFGSEDLIYGEPHIERPEEAFVIENKKPKWNARGFMDKPIQYESSRTLKIVDYKSSKMKFRGEELTGNVQAMMYTLAAHKIWPDKFDKIIVQFMFIKFPRSPIQELEFSKEELKGFELYLEYVNKIISNFDERNAETNFAIDGGWKTKWMCGPTKSGWECPNKKPFDYYVLLGKDDNFIKSSFKNEFEPKEGERVEKKEYGGCPRFQNIEEEEDPFNL